MRRLVAWCARRVIRLIGYGSVGCVAMLVAVIVYVSESRPDLEPWHTADLDEEFTARSPVSSFGEYLALEDRLFRQLDELVYDADPPGDGRGINRYTRGSISDPARWATETNWNRSVKLKAEQPRAGVLLLHGLSDSPYSMRSMGESLHAHGATVLILRIPGHGTAPSGLTSVRWQDMAAAVELASKHLRAEVPDAPLYAVGYSNGGALAVNYSLSALSDPQLPPFDGVVLLSPEIGITKLAALASWQRRLAHGLGLQKLQWQSIHPEYDPFKYGSFALNAAELAHRITLENQSRIAEHTSTGAIERFPPVLAFQSAVDATVEASALVRHLLDRLPSPSNELVLFDVNREHGIDDLLKKDPGSAIEQMLDAPSLPFTLTVFANKNERTRQVVVTRRAAGEQEATTLESDLEWPQAMYSLSHVALPFPPDDPVYGATRLENAPGIQLGSLVIRGERGALQVHQDDLLRLRWNPFHDDMVQRTLEFMRLD